MAVYELMSVRKNKDGKTTISGLHRVVENEDTITMEQLMHLNSRFPVHDLVIEKIKQKEKEKIQEEVVG